ncbi:hypothetical protein EXU85_26885 [Spirosoma sp. KCTC 42546]|uniref:hypothetical protein n=1 Tax=Spirosoma sp. KCTC 42546 TaxID=2520506 RepID=UPI00115A3753|nr:hypothetical protein [Spirosoma sp. KCTC 42546]QDK82036.1 hypothetical protein EXU85_26885 [Spirosoma sp. KCTC 42546]
MRTFYLFAGAIIFLLGCQDGNKVDPFNAPVQSLADLPADYQPIQNGSSVAGRLKSEVHAGQLSGEWLYNQQGKLVEGRRYLSGQITTADQYRYDAAGQLRYVQHFTNGCAFSSLSTCSGPITWISYDDINTDNLGRIRESHTFLKQSGQWELQSITAYEYDNQNKPLKILRYDSSRKLGSTQEFTYDNKGNIISLRELNTTGTPDLADRTFTYDYDQGLNPYAGTVHYISPFFSSRHMLRTAGATYEYAPNGYPVRIQQNNLVTELSYY